MKAVVVSKLGDPEVLEYKDIPIPSIGPRDVLIEVHAASVNFADTKARKGEYHGVTTSQFIPGLDCAGVIKEVGKEVKSLKKGKKVIAFPEEGSYAEFVKADESLVYSFPENLDLEKGAAILTVGVTAYNVLIKMARLTPGETVLVHAAAGGVGTMAIKLAKYFGAGTIIGTVSSDEKKEIALNAGADYIINYSNEDFVELVNSHTENEGVDVILDTISGENFERSMLCLAHFGRIVIFGHANTGSHPGNLKTDTLHSSCRSVIGYSTGTYRELNPKFLETSVYELLNLLKQDKIEPLISKKFRLEEVVEAHRLIESRKSTGKILLIP